MANWTKDNIPNLEGKVFVVTGANNGLGYESALALAEKGAIVIMACRNHERAQHSLEAIKQTVPSAKLEIMELDLASLKSIEAFSKAYKSKYDQLDVLMHNGGVVLPPRNLTADGFESQFGVNHLAPFALTGQLLEVLLKTPASRVVTVSSREHVTGKIPWDDLMSEHNYNPSAVYSQSKLAVLLFTFELNRRLESKGTTTSAIVAHPGRATTGWVENNITGFQKLVMGLIVPRLSQSAAMGALPQLYAAVDANAKSGSYYGPDQDTKGYPVEIKASDHAYDEEDAKRLWELSEKLTGVEFSALQN